MLSCTKGLLNKLTVVDDLRARYARGCMVCRGFFPARSRSKGSDQRSCERTRDPNHAVANQTLDAIAALHEQTFDEQ